MFELLSPPAGHNSKVQHILFPNIPFFYLKINKNEKYVIVHKYILDASIFCILVHKPPQNRNFIVVLMQYFLSNYVSSVKNE